MDEAGKVLTTLGVALLIGLATDAVGRRTRVPRVTLLLIFGFLVGPGALNLLPAYGEETFNLAANMALVMVGFLLGEKFTFKALKADGKLVLWLSLAQVVGTALAVGGGLILLGFPPPLALLLAGVAPATDPAATTDVIGESRAKGRFTNVLLGIVAVDDAWGLICFSLLAAVATGFAGTGSGAELLAAGAWEIGGALLLGLGLGVPGAYLTGRVARGEPTLVEALGIVLLCGGLAIWMEVSFLLAAMVLGAAISNLAKHHHRPFHAIEGIEWPFMVIFFVFAGASLHLGALARIGLIATAYCMLRVAGRIGGAWIGGNLTKSGPAIRNWMGMALMPQAGVALGMALVATEKFPDLGAVLLPVVIGATVIFEILGPVSTKIALIKAGEAGMRHNSR
jgi:Kef-type K+ transport system membrane component KefB